VSHVQYAAICRVRGAWYTRGVTEYQVHLLWLAGRGLHLWAERVDGHAAVMDAAEVGAGELPAELHDVLRSRPLRRRERISVATPKGKVKVLDLPTQAYTPEQALAVLGRLSRYIRTAGTSSPASADAAVGPVPGLSPEAVWLVRFYEVLVDLVHAGRVMLKTQFSDGQWYPTWCVATSGDHNRVLQEFQSTAPSVLTVNGGPDALLRAADDLVHWMCVRLLQARLAGEDAEPDNHFVAALVSGDVDPRATVATADALNDWRRSARQASTRIVLSLEEPESLSGTEDLSAGDTGDTGNAVDAAGTEELRRWRLVARLSTDDGPAEPVVAAEAFEGTRQTLREHLDRAYQAWPELKAMASAPEAWLRTSVWFPPPESLTGQSEKDRVVYLSLTNSDVENLLAFGVPELAAAGVDVQVPRGWSSLRPSVTLKVTPVGQGPGSGKLGLDQVLSFDWAVSVDGEELSGAEMVDLLSTAKTVVELHGRYVRLDTRSLGTARNYFSRLRAAEREQHREKLRRESARRGEPAGDPTEATGGHLRLVDFLESESAAADQRQGEDSGDLRIEADGWVDRVVRAVTPPPEGAEGPEGPEGGDGPSLPTIDPPEQIAVPQMVTAELREHQQRGLNWLVWMYRHRIGAILADDMGLGKTLQVLALLAWEREAGDCEGPTLVVAPTSVLDTWRSEVAAHVPGLQVVVDHGQRKVPEEEFSEVATATDIVVTTYGTLSRNPQRYQQVRWGRVVLDEAQNIKNPGTSQSQAARSLSADHRIALTGTPVENRLSELHSIMDFCNPGVLGSAQSFQNRLAIPVERYEDDDTRERLRRLVEPFVLRRVKTDASVGLNLPEKSELIDLVPLTEEQAALYQAYTEDLNERMSQSGGKGRSGIILGALVRIKQILNHPAHFTGDGSGLMKNGRHRSKKVERLFDIVTQALDAGRKVLIFTQFPSFGEMLIPELSELVGSTVPLLHGGLSRRKRTEMVDSFQSEHGPPVMILSTRAGGTGITLTHASVVVHIDRWWNPAVEDQATDRAYRIGQGREVTVHKLVTTGTLDERINDILSAKRELAGDIVSAGEGWITRLDDQDLAELWKLNRSSVDRELTSSSRAAPVGSDGKDSDE
jgi:superfamily II DNA or RNA helicase